MWSHTFESNKILMWFTDWKWYRAGSYHVLASVNICAFGITQLWEKQTWCLKPIRKFIPSSDRGALYKAGMGCQSGFFCTITTVHIQER